MLELSNFIFNLIFNLYPDHNISMAFLPLLIAGLSALAGGLANRSSTQNQRASFNNIQATTPTYDPETMGLRNTILNNYMNMMPGTSGYQNFINQGISGINRSSDLQRQNLQSILAARGIQGPAAGNSLAGLENSRFSNILNFTQNAPYQALAGAGNFFSQIPKGATTTSSGTQTGQFQQPGNILGGGTAGLANVLAYLYGQGSFNPTQRALNPYISDDPGNS